MLKMQKTTVCDICGRAVIGVSPGDWGFMRGVKTKSGYLDRVDFCPKCKLSYSDGLPESVSDVNEPARFVRSETRTGVAPCQNGARS